MVTALAEAAVRAVTATEVRLAILVALIEAPNTSSIAYRLLKDDGTPYESRLLVLVDKLAQGVLTGPDEQAP